MKKVNLLFFSVCLVAAGFFSGCTKDDETTATISFAGDTGYTAADATLAPGATFKIKWTATSPTNMAFVSITRDDIALSAWDMEEIANADKSTYIDEATITLPASGGPYTYAVVIYDKDEVEIVSKKIVITLEAAAGAIGTYLDVNMGGSASNYGSYLDAEAGQAYLFGQLSEIVKGKIDIIFNNSEFRNTAAALTSATGTKFASTTITPATFTAMTNDASFSSLTGTLDNITIAAGNVVFFVTKAGKKGLIRVISMTSATGDLKIDIKVQQ